MNDTTSNLIGQLIIALIGVMTLLLANFARRTAAAINDAVNHQHAEAPKLIDHILSLSGKIDTIYQWMMSYRGGPLDTGEKVEHFHKFVSEEAMFNRSKMSELRKLVDENRKLVMELQASLTSRPCQLHQDDIAKIKKKLEL